MLEPKTDALKDVLRKYTYAVQRMLGTDLNEMVLNYDVPVCAWWNVNSRNSYK